MFDQISTYTIPVLHPVLVHFPVALGIASLLFAFVWVVRNRMYWLSITMWLQSLAFVMGVFALRTGEVMKEQSEGVAIVDELVSYHETLAERAVWVLGISIAWMIFARWKTSRDTNKSGAKRWIRFTTFLLVLAAAILLGLTAHIGGLMTWGIPV